ncbi:helix-turn-helix domain-containing protein [Streptomyces massasporeus]
MALSACPETERFAALLRSLKSRSGLSYEALARKSGLAGSTLHRYCRGTSVPQDYGSVHRLATVCGASPDELRTLHRLWALADAARAAAAAGAGTAGAGEEGNDRAEPEADGRAAGVPDTASGRGTETASDAAQGRGAEAATGTEQGRGAQPAEGAAQGRGTEPATGAAQHLSGETASGAAQHRGTETASGAAQGRGTEATTGAAESRDAAPTTKADQHRGAELGTDRTPGRGSESGTGQTPGLGAESGTGQTPGLGAESGTGQTPGQGAEPATDQKPGRGAEPGTDQKPVRDTVPATDVTPGQDAGPDAQPGTGTSPRPAGSSRRRRLRTSVVAAAVLAAVGVSAWALTNGRSPSGGGGGRGTGEDRPLFSANCSPVIAMGQHDECVREVQRLLHAKGADIGVDGDFGPQTLRRVTAFQVLAGLQPNGVVGEPTKKALYTSRVRMGVWSPQKVRKRVREVFPEVPDKAVAIADCQSFLDPLHILPNTNGTRNWGLFQISDARLRELGGTPREALDPEWNIRAARKLWSRDRDFGDWPHCERAADAPRSPATAPSGT